jgi:uncharacterized protein with beta-barrel porin domain
MLVAWRAKGGAVMSVCKVSVLGVATATLLLSSTAQAQNFTIHNGQTVSNQALGAIGDVGIVESGGTIDAVTNDVDAVDMQDDNQTFENMVGGLVKQSGNQAAAVFSDNANANIVNSGAIIALGLGSDGIVSASTGFNAFITNQGSIETRGDGATGIISAGDNSVVNNSGSILSTGQTAFGIILDGAGSRLNNSGAIETTDATSASLIVAGNGTTVTNSGRIISTLDSTSEAIIINADDVTLNLLAGTVIQGNIDIDGSNGTINIGNGLNTALTFNFFSLPDLNTNGMPYVLNEGLLAVVDPTGFAAQDEVLSDLTGAISGAVDNRFAAARTVNAGASVAMNGMVVAAAADLPQGTGPEFWFKAIDGYRDQAADNPQVGFHNLFGGFVLGADGDVGFASRAGLFAGASLGKLETDSNSQKIDSSNFFAGAYGSFNAESAFLDLSAALGTSSFDSDRRVANNLVLGGIEHAVADYDGVFISPAATLGTNIAMGSTVLTPSIRARYAALFLGGYSETGSAANLDIASRHVEVLELRGQLTIAPQPYDFMGGMMTSALRVGVDGSFRNNSAVDATLLGQTLSFAAGGRDDVVRGFVGLDGQYKLVNGWQVESTMELGLASDHSFTTEGRVGLNIPL